MLINTSKNGQLASVTTMPRYDWVVHFGFLGDPCLFMIPVPTGMKYETLIDTLNDYAWLCEENSDRRVDRLVKVSAHDSVSRAIKDEECIEGPTQKAWDEEVLVKWIQHCFHADWSFTIDPFCWIPPTSQSPPPAPPSPAGRHGLCTLQTRYYEWVVYVVPHKTSDVRDDHRWCMIVQNGTTVKQLKMLVTKRMGDQIEHVSWRPKALQERVACSEMEPLLFSGEFGEQYSKAEMSEIVKTGAHYELVSRWYGIRYQAGVFPARSIFHQSLRHNVLNLETEMWSVANDDKRASLTLEKRQLMEDFSHGESSTISRTATTPDVYDQSSCSSCFNASSSSSPGVDGSHSDGYNTTDSDAIPCARPADGHTTTDPDAIHTARPTVEH